MPKAIRRKLPKRRAAKKEPVVEEVVEEPIVESSPQPVESEEVKPTIADEDATHFLMEDASDDEHADELSSIYFDAGEKKVDMTKLEKKSKKVQWIIAAVLFVIALIGVVAYSGYIIFQRDKNAGNGTVELELQVEEKVASGDVVNVELTYVNHKPVTVETGDIELFFPDGFLVQSTTPEPEEANGYLWKVKDLKSGAAGKIRITGQLVGEKDDKKDITAQFTYRPSNFSQDFQITAKKTVLITESVISAEVEAPTQVQADQEFTYAVEFKNTSKVALNDVRIMVEYPKGFTFVSASREAFGGNDVWNIETLEPNKAEKLEIKGKLEGKSGEAKEIIFQLGLLELDNTFHAQIEKTSSIIVVNPEVDVTLDVPKTVEVGQELIVKVNVKNTSELDMKDVDVRLSLNGSLFTETEYTFEKISKLNSLASKELTYTTTLKKKGSSSQQLEVAAKVLSASVTGNTINFDDQVTAKIKVQGTIAATSEGRYYDEDLTKVGSGPLPPVVGEKTTYLIRWNMASGINEAKSVSISAILPAGVTLEPTSEVLFDSATRKVSFTQATLAPQTQLALEFFVSVVPTQADVNKLLVLTESTTFTGVDSFTQEQLTITEPRITSDLPNDEGASGKGVVQAD